MVDGVGGRCGVGGVGGGVGGDGSVWVVCVARMHMIAAFGRSPSISRSRSCCAPFLGGGLGGMLLG